MGLWLHGTSLLGSGKAWGAGWIHRVQKTSFWGLEAEGLHCLNGYETSGTCPIYFLLPAPTPSGFLDFSVQNMFGLWLLITQHYSLASKALLLLCKAFCWCLLQKTNKQTWNKRRLLLFRVCTVERQLFRVTLFISSNFNEIILWFKNNTDLQCNYLQVCIKLYCCKHWYLKLRLKCNSESQ